jgi:hypothetical protein
MFVGDLYVPGSGLPVAVGFFLIGHSLVTFISKPVNLRAGLLVLPYLMTTDDRKRQLCGAVWMITANICVRTWKYLELESLQDGRSKIRHTICVLIAYRAPTEATGISNVL